jgi:hypothetical protein
MCDKLVRLMKSKWGIWVASMVGFVEILFAVAVFNKIHTPFEVIVVSLLGYVYVCIIEASTDFEKYKLMTRTALHNELTNIKVLVGGKVDEETDSQIKEAYLTHKNSETGELILKLGHFIIVLIILWNLSKTLFFS